MVQRHIPSPPCPLSSFCDQPAELESPKRWRSGKASARCSVHASRAGAGLRARRHAGAGGRGLPVRANNGIEVIRELRAALHEARSRWCYGAAWLRERHCGSPAPGCHRFPPNPSTPPNSSCAPATCWRWRRVRMSTTGPRAAWQNPRCIRRSPRRCTEPPFNQACGIPVRLKLNRVGCREYLSRPPFWPRPSPAHAA